MYTRLKFKYIHCIYTVHTFKIQVYTLHMHFIRLKFKCIHCRRVSVYTLYSFEFRSTSRNDGTDEWVMSYTDINLIWIWYEFDMNLIWIWYEFDMNLIWIWYEFDMNTSRSYATYIEHRKCIWELYTLELWSASRNTATDNQNKPIHSTT